jgi:hypothetical protein
MLDLKQFCYDSEDKFWIRPELEVPWSVGEYTYATDTVWLVRVPKRDDIHDGGEDAKERLAKVARHFDGIGPPTYGPMIVLETFVVPGKPAVQCDDCKGTGYTRSCSHCEGEGSLECPTCGSHDLDCEECDGRGFFSCEKDHEDAAECDDCEDGISDEAVPEKHRVRLGQQWFDRERLNMLAAALPGFEVSPLAEGVKFDAKAEGVFGPPLRIRFDGGVALLMPMTAPEIVEISEAAE